MRVLVAHNFYRSAAPSGEDQAVVAEREMLETAGLEVVRYERQSDELDDYGKLRILNAAVAATWSNRSYRDISDLLVATKPDLAHFHNTFPLISPSVYAACQEHKVPVVQTLHNYRLICPGALLLRDDRPCEDCVGQSLWPALRHRCYRRSIGASASVALMLTFNRWRGSYSQAVDQFITLTKFAAGRFAAGGLPSEKIAVKGNFLSDRLVPKSKVEKQNYAVYVGRLSAEKGIQTLVSAWQQAPPVPLMVVGDGPLRGELEAFARSKDIWVKFLGRLERKEVIDVVSKALFQIIPSLCYEGFPLAVVEAYACGTPVLASRVGSLVELVQPNVTGLLFEPGNAQDIRGKVDRAIHCSARQGWPESARRMFDENYSEQKNLNHLLEIYISVQRKKIIKKSPNNDLVGMK